MGYALLSCVFEKKLMNKNQIKIDDGVVDLRMAMSDSFSRTC
jgi:hypothetical protein